MKIAHVISFSLHYRMYCHKISTYQFKLNQPSKPCSKLGINLCGPMHYISRESTPSRCVFLSLVWWLISWRCRSEWAHLFMFLLMQGHRVTSLWVSDSNHYLTVTCVWQWPVSDCDQYLTVAIIWLWPRYDCDQYLTVIRILLWPGCEWDQYLTVISIWLWHLNDCVAWVVLVLLW